MTVLVTGATGFLGTALVRLLLQENEAVRVLARDAHKAQQLFGTQVDIIQGQITERHKVEAAIRGINVIYHLAGRLYHPSTPTRLYQETHITGTKILLDCCQCSASLTRLIHCSTTGVYGVTGQVAANEHTTYAPTNPYEATKLESERLALRAYREYGLPITIIRPGLVYGPGDLHLLGFFRQIARGLPATIAGGRAHIHPIYINDMSRAFLLAAYEPQSIGCSYNIAGEAPVSFAELAQIIARAVRRPLFPCSLPLWCANMAADLFERLPGWQDENAPLTRSRIHFLTHSRIYDISQARHALGFSPRVNLDEGIRYTAAWYREHGYL